MNQVNNDKYSILLKFINRPIKTFGEYLPTLSTSDLSERQKMKINELLDKLQSNN